MSVLLVTLQQLWVLRGAIINDTEQDLSRLNMVVADYTARTMEAVELLLSDAVEASRDPQRRMNPEALGAWLQRKLAGMPQASAILIADRDGTVIGTTLSSQFRSIPPEAQPLLSEYVAGAQGPLIGAPFRLPNGDWAVFLGHPIEAAATPEDSPAPKLQGVALAIINLGYFDEFYRSIDLADGGAITLLHRNGLMLSRYPRTDALIGASFAGIRPFKDILASRESGTLVTASSVDGNMRVLAVRALTAFPLAVFVSVDQSRLLAGWWRQVVLVVAAALLVAVLSVVLLLKLAERSRAAERLLQEMQASVAEAEQANHRLREQIVEREHAETALTQAQRMGALGQLTGGVAHDFNNLLTVLLSNIDMLERTPGQSCVTEERLVAMRAAAMRGATLTGQLLTFARREPLEPVAVDLSRTVGEMRDLLRIAVGGRIRIDLDLADEPWPTVVDPTLIELAILNLAINARDAMQGEGVLTITTGNRLLSEPEQPEEPSSGPYVTVSVRDTGAGMSPEVRARVFEPFFSTKAPGAGSGLGLPQVLGTARKAGGGVQIASAPGQGTTISILLPRAQVGVDCQAAPQPASLAPGRTATILLVDDDAPVRDVTACLLRDLGYEVREASSAAAALRALDTDPEITLLLTDLAMPYMTGAQLARVVAARRPDLPIVFLSGYADPETLAGFGSHPYLVRKPFRPSDLRNQIEAALGGVEAA